MAADADPRTPDGRNPNAPQGGVGGALPTQGGFTRLYAPGAGGVNGAQAGYLLGPNGEILPQWNPQHAGAGGFGAAYMNMWTPASSQPGVTSGNQFLHEQLVNGQALMPVNRGVPGQDVNDAGREMQLGAAGAVMGAGASQAAQQAQLPGQIRASGAPSANVQGQLMAGGQRLGAPQAAGQQLLSSYLGQQAMGQGGPTAAGSLFQQATDRNIAQQRALSMGVRGQGAAGAARQGTQAGVQLGLQAQAQAGALRAQEQQAAQGLLAQNLATSRGQAIDTFATRGAQASQAGQDALGRDAAIAQILAGSRGQDISQAMAGADVLGQMRGQDQQFSQLGLQGQQQNDALQQQRIMNAMQMQQFLANFNLADQGMTLDAAGMMGNLQTGQQAAAAQRRQVELMERGQNIQLAGAGLGAGGALIGGMA